MKRYSEIAAVGVITRARAALAMAATSAASSPRKKIKRVSTATTPFGVDQLRSLRRNIMAPANSPDRKTASKVAVAVDEEVANCSSCEIISSDFPPCCSGTSSNSSSSSEKDRLEIIAQLVESAETSSRYFGCHRAAREEIIKLEGATSDDLDSPATRLPAEKSTVQIKMPSDSEIEDFFAAAENDLQKRFSDKYNFDIVKDVPLEGRYEWVPIKP